MGWAGLTNGELLTNAEGKFDVFITIDRSMTFQQNISRFTLFLIVLHVKSTRLADVEPLAQQIIDAINKAQPGTVAHVG